MELIPGTCMDINSIGSFCDCIEASGRADVAVENFCTRAREDNGKSLTGDDLVELKKAIKDLDVDMQ